MDNEEAWWLLQLSSIGTRDDKVQRLHKVLPKGHVTAASKILSITAQEGTQKVPYKRCKLQLNGTIKFDYSKGKNHKLI